MTDEDRFGRDVAKALEARRPSPSRDFEARLVRAAARPYRTWLVPAVLAGAVAACAIVVAVLSLTGAKHEDDQQPTVAAGVNAPRPGGSATAPAPAADPLVKYQVLLDGGDPGLGLDDGQRGALRDLADRLATRRATLGAEREVAMIELRRELDGRIVEATKASAILTRVSDADAALRKAELEARLAARALLSDGQRLAFERGSRVGSTVPQRAPAPPAKPATLDIASDPPGAQVFVDGVMVGKAPVRVAYTPGRHAVQLRLPGYKDHKLDLDLAAGESQRVMVALEAASVIDIPSTAIGTLRMTSSPWSTVSVDGRRVGETPCKIALSVGKHVVTFARDSRKITKPVVVTRNTTVTVTASFDADPF